MIEMFTGVPGSGKSLDAAAIVRRWLDCGRPVLANFRLAPTARVRHPSLFTFCDNQKLTADYLEEYCLNWWRDHDFAEDEILLVWDECQLCLNSRNWMDRNRMRFLEFLSQSRKYGVRVILVAQSPGMIDKQIRDLVDTNVIHRKVSTCGFIGWIMSLPFRRRLFWRITYLYQANERLGSDLFLYHKRDADIYDSYARFRQQELNGQR